MKNTNSNIRLKSGLIKSIDFTDEFYKTNKLLCDKFLKLYDKMFHGVCSMFQAQDKHKHNEAIKIEMLDMLDELYDLDVKIWNGFDNKTYKSKKAYRDYVLTYGINDE